MFGLHHYRKQHNRSIQKRKYPFLDIVIYAGAIFGPIFTIPQIYLIWVDRNVAGVSLISWSGYLIGAVIWLIYGYVHKDWPIIVTNSVLIILNSLVVTGILLFR